MRVRGDLCEVRAADLRFSVEEAATYLNDAMGLALTEGDVVALETRTEGWIAALQLAALSLRGREDASGFIAGFAGDDRFVVDYLIDEVLDRQPDDIRSFLLDTSILSRFTASLCAEVTGRKDARAVLDALERSNLFLVALDGRREWYRYHHLFADALRTRLTDHPDARRITLHRRAGEWWEANGDRAEAIRHALAAGDVAWAAELIELAVPSLRRTRQDSTLRTWMDALPEEVFADRPVLDLGRVGSRMVTGDIEGVGEILDRIEGWLGHHRPTDTMVAHDRDELARLPGQAAMYRAGLALLTGDVAATVAHGERATMLSDPGDHLGQGAAAALIGLAQWTSGDLGSAARRYEDAISAFIAGDQLPAVLGCSLALADLQVGQGRLDAAERTLTTAVELTAPHGPQRGIADMHIGLAEVHLERNDLAEAAGELRISRRFSEHLALAQHAHRWRIVDARLRAIEGDLTDSLALLRDAERHYDTDYSPKARPVGALGARMALMAGDVASAEEWARSTGIAEDDEPDYLREYEHLTFARVLIAGGRTGDAIALSERVLMAAESSGRESAVFEALLLISLAHHADGRRGKAIATVADALDRAGAEGFVRLVLDLGAPMRALLTAATFHGRSADRAAAVLAAARSRAPIPDPRSGIDPLSPRELDVLARLRTELSGPEIAAELFVSLNTVRSHTKSIYSKLGVTNRRAAVRRADELGL